MHDGVNDVQANSYQSYRTQIGHTGLIIPVHISYRR